MEQKKSKSKKEEKMIVKLTNRCGKSSTKFLEQSTFSPLMPTDFPIAQPHQLL